MRASSTKVANRVPECVASISVDITMTGFSRPWNLCTVSASTPGNEAATRSAWRRNGVMTPMSSGGTPAQKVGIASRTTTSSSR
jgi:hypothetical protein